MGPLQRCGGPQVEVKVSGRNLSQLLTLGFGPVEVWRSIVVHAWNCSRWVAEPGRLGVPDQYGLYSETPQDKDNSKA